MKCEVRSARGARTRADRDAHAPAPFFLLCRCDGDVGRAVRPSLPASRVETVVSKSLTGRTLRSLARSSL